MWVLWYSYYMTNLGKFCDCEVFSCKITTTWRATQTSNVGNEWNKGETKPGPVTSILIHVFKAIPVNSERRCSPGLCSLCTKDLFRKGRAERIKSSVSPLCFPSFNFSSLEIADLRLGTKPSHQARDTMSKIHNVWMWLETGKSVL